MLWGNKAHDADGESASEPLAKRLKTEDNAVGANGDSSYSPGGVKDTSFPNTHEVEETPEARAFNPDEYVRVIPVSRKPQGEPQVGWHPVQLSRIDKASQMEVSECRRRVTSRKGYRMIRATHGCHEGTWYYEIEIERLGETGHCRVGWATKRAEVQAPVGFDEYGFSYRDLEGTKQHKALREDYGSPYTEGDVIGCLIHLGEGGRPLEKKAKEIVRWRGILHYVDEPDPDPNVLSGSSISFLKNGVFQGIAYSDIFEGTYYPSGSLYTHPDEKEGATLFFNFGPDFQYPPPALEDYGEAAKPFCEMAGDPPKDDPGAASEKIADQTLSSQPVKQEETPIKS